MATEFINEFEVCDEDKVKNLGLTEIFVRVQMGANIKYFPLSKIVEYVNDSTFRRINSISQFNNLLEKQRSDGQFNLKALNNNDEMFIGSSVLNDTGFYTLNQAIPELYVSDDLNGVKLENGKEVEDNVEYGLKRAVEIRKSDGFNSNDPYVYVELNDGQGMKFVKKSEIGYYDLGQFISLQEIQNNGGDVLDAIKDKDLFTNENVYVSKIFTSSTCSVGLVKEKEELDIENLKIKSFEVKENGEIEKVDINLEAKYSEQFAYKKDGQSLLDIANYEVDTQGKGDYIKVVFKGETVPTLIDISDLHFMNDSGRAGEQIEKTDFQANHGKYVGKSLVYATGTGEDAYERELEPLTLQQASTTFKHITTMQENTDENAVMQDGTYLRLKDGRYVEENKTVRPNCYDFVNYYDTDFDAYFVLYEPISDFKGAIVNKDVFKSQSMVLSPDGKQLKLNNAIKIKLSAKPMSECDLVQTSSLDQMVESAELLSKPALNEMGVLDYSNLGDIAKTQKTAEEKDEIIKKANEKFVEDYKNGIYVLDKVVDDEGKLVELDPQHKRYSLTEMSTIVDPSCDRKEYKYFGSGDLVYDAKTGKLTGGKIYDTKEAIAKELGKGVRNLFIAGCSLFSLGGVFALAIAPVAVAALFAGLTVYPIGKAIYEGIKGYNINKKYYNYEKIDENRKVFSDEINEELADLYSQTKDKLAQTDREAVRKFVKNQILSDPELANLKGDALQKKIDERINAMSKDDYKSLTNGNRMQYFGVFLDRMKRLEEKADNLSTTNLKAEFRVEDGKAKVTPENAAMFSKYRQDILALQKEIRKLSKQAKHNPEKQREMQAKISQYNLMTTNYISMGEEKEKDQLCETTTDKVYMMKAMILLKEFGDIIEKEGFASEFDEDDKKFISHLEYDPIKSQFTYDGKVFETSKLSVSTVARKLTKGKASTKLTPIETVLTTITQKLCDFGREFPSYDYEKGKGCALTSSINCEKDKVMEKKTETTAEATKANEAEATATSEVETIVDENVSDADNDKKDKNSKVERKDKGKSAKSPETKTRLSPESLEALLNNIFELGKLDRKYFDQDEDIDNDIDDKIDKLEKLIRKDLHLFDRVAKNKNDKYAKYKSQIIEADEILKKHKLINERNATFNVETTI